MEKLLNKPTKEIKSSGNVTAQKKQSEENELNRIESINMKILPKSGTSNNSRTKPNQGNIKNSVV